MGGIPISELAVSDKDILKKVNDVDDLSDFDLANWVRTRCEGHHFEDGLMVAIRFMKFYVHDKLCEEAEFNLPEGGSPYGG